MKIRWLLVLCVWLPFERVFALAPESHKSSSKPTSLLPLSKTGTSVADIQVTGTITDDKGEILPGVSILLKGTSIGTTTNSEGKYSLTIPDGTKDPVLIFSFIGYTTEEVTVGNRTSVDVKLLPDLQSLSEVVVVGYGTQKRSDITGSVSSVPKARLSQLPVTNVLQAVQGSVAGVNITQSSSVPGTAPSTIIRGQNSINANSGPFVVVDGIPLSKTGGSLNDINPNDIESMEVLKDASAVAIYGVNGANGVILITTKRGTSGKPTIRYNAYTGIENFSHILKPRNGAEYVQKYKDYRAQVEPSKTDPVPNFGEVENYNAGIETDWIKEATQTGILQDHNVSISGGASNVKYFISGEYLDQKGVVKGFQYKRVSFRSNLDVTLTDYLTIGTSLFIANNNRDGGRANLLNASAMSPYGQKYNADGTYKIFPMAPEQLYTNPLLGLTTDRIDRSTNLNGNTYAEVKFSGFLTGLKYRMNLGYTYLPARTASYTGRAANDNVGTAKTFNSETNSFVLENILSYSKDFGVHHLDFTGLYSAQQRRYIQTEANATGFANDQLSFNNLGAGATQSSASMADRYGLNSQMGRINYSYNSRYLLTLTARRDGSSVMGSNTSKYGLFPSAAIGWNIINESFMKSVTPISNLKLRFSYGKSGNEAINVYGTITKNTIARSPFNGLSSVGVVAGNLGNDNLGWESTLSRNLGLDFGLFNDRISGSIDIYKNNTKGLLLLRSLPIITGYSNVYDNLGETSNSGIELTLNTHNIDKGDFKWESTIVFASNKNRILDIYGDKKDDVGNRWFIGKPIGVVYDYKMEGIWQTGEDPGSVDPTAVPGDLKFADLNGDKRITPDNDRMILGQTAPKWTGGFTNTFHYKNIHLNIFIQTVQGITRNNADLTYADETGKRNTPIDVGYWTPENQSNTRPSLGFKNPRGYGYASDASYTRIKDVTLSYVFGQKIIDKLHLGSLTAYVSGRNLYTFTNWIGWDPEAFQQPRGVSNSSGDWVNNYPLTRSFVFGLNVSLR
ncbi:SusC/RagA family TonB-linked outer membrane protein [Xanthocytophaga flava]|uniref:SusC/RagA family TonB-linked outer membrane protein n=1 Tax=Xanthocytophaga flava TaxID=3048013 RepID=UPI0028D8E31D|nr:TonB-dependent receptor [Xanthocytophaga flavus]MDJ1467172.1 TonB-dependent receptor [Xanthocytophaga flavus]